MLKKYAAMLLVLSMIVALVAGCGSTAATTASGAAATDTSASSKESASQANNVVLRVEIGNEDYTSQLPGLFQTLKADFEKENPGVTIEYTAIPFDEIKNKQLVELQSGDVPDVAYCNWVKDFASNGYLEDLTPYISKWDKLSELSAGQQGRMQYDNKFYAYTWRNNSIMLYYNKDIFAQAGVTAAPTTWEEWTAACQKIKDANLKTKDGKQIYAFAWPQIDAVWNDSAFLFAAGAKEFSDDLTKVTLDSPEAITGMKYFQSMVKNGYMLADTDYSTNQSLFTNGQAAMWSSGDWDWPTLSKSAVKDSIDMVMLPKGPKGYGAPLGGVDLVVFKGSKNVELANKFLQTLISQKYELYLMENCSSVPTLKSSYDLPIAKENKVVSTIGQTVREAAQFVYMENPWMKPELNTEWKTTLSRILVKGEDVETVLKEENAKMNDMLAKK